MHRMTSPSVPSCDLPKGDNVHQYPHILLGPLILFFSFPSDIILIIGVFLCLINILMEIVLMSFFAWRHERMTLSKLLDWQRGFIGLRLK